MNLKCLFKLEQALYFGTLLFILSEIHTLYVNCLEDLGIKIAINKTRLKNQLLEHFSERHRNSTIEGML